MIKAFYNNYLQSEQVKFNITIWNKNIILYHYLPDRIVVVYGMPVQKAQPQPNGETVVRKIIPTEPNFLVAMTLFVVRTLYEIIKVPRCSCE